MSETELIGDLALLATITSFMGEAVVYSPDTGFWYHCQGLPTRVPILLLFSTFFKAIRWC